MQEVGAWERSGGVACCPRSAASEKIACINHDKLIRARPIVGRDRVCCTACRGLHAPVLLEVRWCRGTMWTHPRIAPCQSASLQEVGGGSVSLFLLSII